ncbi:hypothetical protein RFI_31778 [Reticulomyxa filosa]|uniref:Uncharacterized protein n=1 Tax=Reticulomyxa filosa TaxID=46433 RepID=X6LUK4_RETFI|nr:hypothetical protein RFI_31778 [Reticulomyxa filosa]|eukprot:ETO05618.1 hypothetical protein RFI_31778 [Reticulomyxa filosa]
MGNRTTAQNSSERKTKRSQQITTHFQTLKKLPIPLMKYVSVWSDDKNNNDENGNEKNKSKQLNQLNKFNKSKNYNQWIPFIGNYNRPINIRSDPYNYEGARALIGGRNNHLLFITYPVNNISVFDLNIFQFIKHDTLPTNDWIWYHCFVSKSEYGQVQEMMKTNQKYKQNYQMLLFCGRQDYQLNIMKITKLFNFINYLSVMIL